MLLGDYIGFNESLQHEFKEFSLKIDPDLFYDAKTILEIVRNGKIPENFNKILIDNLNYYFQIYIPKYVSAFSNCEELEEGILYFGVNNIGEITGIPFFGELNTKDLEKILYSVIDSVSLEEEIDKLYIEKIFKEIKIELITLDIEEELISDKTEEEILIAMTKYQNYIERYNTYKEDHAKWINDLMSFTHKISYIILDR